ncbi:MAG: endopeptidase La, partial [candidate division WOR-3 bacterium]
MSLLIPDPESLKELPEVPQELPILPLRDSVVFPVMITPLMVGREASKAAVEEALAKEDRLLGTIAQKDPAVDNPTFDDLYEYGTAIVIRMLGRVSEGIRMVVQGIARFRVVERLQETPFLKARIKVIPDRLEEEADPVELEAFRRNLVNLFERVIALSPNMPDELRLIAQQIEEPHVLTDLIAAQLNFKVADKQDLLETLSLKERMRKLMQLLVQEVQVLEVGRQLQSEVTEEMSKAQREYYLREQLKAIQRELGELDERTREIEELQQRIAEARMPPEAEKEALRELDRLAKMSPGSPEYTVARTYIDWLVSLPWTVATEDNLELAHVHQVLDEDHYGLEKVKERILEYLAVRRFKQEGSVRQPILCFVGPPGVGKTSLGRSIARAMGRKFVRISLGGMRDEAEIRGHRRTYIGALPGQIIQGIRRAGTNNPVFMLDEIDKVGVDWRGDPSSALLEVLDPEQNFSFRDHYLDVPFDLSKVFFITTANVLDTILPPLRDRMEVIEIGGYTEEEKTAIAQRHLIPKQMEEHGLTGNHFQVEEEAVRYLIRHYTREAGVRNLERQIAALCRKAVRTLLEGAQPPIRVTRDWVEEALGAPRYLQEEVLERLPQPGVAIGVAWTPTGGDVLFVEAVKMPGKGQLILTGSLGEVMKESAQAALSYLRASASIYDISLETFEKFDLHVHVPSGAIPKDGPSAGVTIAAALLSLLTRRLVKPRLAMTGEITLTGRVLKVGGIREKLLAAHRSGIKRVIIPSDNLPEIEAYERKLMRQIQIIPVETVSKI